MKCLERFGMKWLREASYLFEYETPRVVTVRHYPLGVLKLIMQICVLVFVLGFQLWHEKGYQIFSPVESSVTTKVKYDRYWGLDCLI